MNYVLIVDDEPLIRASLSKKVEAYGNGLVVSANASNGGDALEWLGKHYCDICITDVSMPVMNGLELIKNIKTKYPWIECIIISSYDDFNYARQGISLGVLDYILKPVDQESLNEALGKAQKKISEDRMNEAGRIIFKKTHEDKKKIDFWTQSLKSLKPQNIDKLVEDVLEVIEQWSEDSIYMMKFISIAWLELIAEELKKDNISINIESLQLSSDQKEIPKEFMEDYFKSTTREQLVNGITSISKQLVGSGNKKSRKVVEQVKQYINDNYKKQITLQELADHVAMSRTYISTLFKNETGTTVWNYLLRVRMEKSEELLKDTNLKCYEVAYEVGYDSEMHFSQTFKEYYGIGPMEYKKRIGV
jgi:two-component system, response regulator YesN